MYTVECPVGRLLEIRVQPPLALEELQNFHSQITKIHARVKGQLIGCVDMRNARVFSPEVANKLMDIIRTDGPHLARNAFLVGESAVFSMQIARVLKTAGVASRRAFLEPEDAISWLSETLTPREVHRLREFITAGAVASPPVTPPVTPP